MTNTAARSLALEILQRLHAHGYTAYWVGGCVRDLLMGHPVKDYDVATSAHPDEILRLFPGSSFIGAAFGVVLVKQDHVAVEVASYRSEQQYRDGRRPEEVRYETDPRLDASRRDFTINALFHNPLSGETLDFFGGARDLEHKLLRAVGDPHARFAEDHLRLLRAIRFAARFQFTIDAATWQAIVLHASSIKRISAERIREELNRILSEGGAARGLRLMRDSGLLAQILPEVEAMQGVEQPPEFHPEGDVWTHTLLMLDQLALPIDPVLAWGVLLHDIGKPATQTISDRIRFNGHVDAGLRIAQPILSRLKFSLEDQERVLALIENHMRFMELPRMRQSTVKRFLRLPHFDQHLELHRVDCLSSHGALDNYRLAREKQNEYSAEQISPPPLLRGGDVLAMGIPPGPRIGKILAAIEEAQLEGAISNREEALALLAQLAAKPPDEASGTTSEPLAGAH